jgi:hypothetical protein
MRCSWKLYSSHVQKDIFRVFHRKSQVEVVSKPKNSG